MLLLKNSSKYFKALTAISFFAFMTTAIALSTSIVWVDSVYAKDQQAKKKKLTKAEKEAKLKYRDGISRKRKALGVTCAKKVGKALEFVEEEDWKTAESELLSALNRGCKEGFEHSEVNRFLGYVLYSQDRTKDAIEAYSSAVNNPEADPQKRTDTRYTLAQLLYVTENYESAMIQLEHWLKEVEIVDKSGKVLLARCYHNLGRKPEAVAMVEEVVAEAEADGLEPKESWLNFQWVLYYEEERFTDAVGVNYKLLTNYPKVKYWKQISAMYNALENAEREMLALELTYLQDGLDKEKQYVALAYQYLAFDVPYRAAVLLEKAMQEEKVERTEKNLSLLGSAYQRAQEYKRASPILEEAAKKAEDGNVWSRLAGVYLNLNENEKALVATINALSKGGLKREDLAWMNRGNAEAALHCYEDAARSFSKAAKFEKSARGAANWRRYVVAEGDRRSKLIANGAKLARCKKV